MCIFGPPAGKQKSTPFFLIFAAFLKFSDQFYTKSEPMHTVMKKITSLKHLK